MSVAQGVKKATSIKANATRLDLKLKVTPESMTGKFEVLSHIKKGKVDLSLYGSAFGEVNNFSRLYNYGVEVGIKGVF